MLQYFSKPLAFQLLIHSPAPLLGIVFICTLIANQPISQSANHAAAAPRGGDDLLKKNKGGGLKWLWTCWRWFLVTDGLVWVFHKPPNNPDNDAKTENMPSEPEVRGERAELASRRIPVRPNSEMGWKTRHLLWLVKALSPLPLQSSAASQPPSFLLLSVFSCIVCYRGSSSLLLSLPGAECHPDGSLHSSFFFMIIFFQTHSQPLRLFFVPTGFCDPVLPHTHTHNYLCTLRLLPRQFIPRARRRREDDIDPGSGCKSSVKLSLPPPQGFQAVEFWID